MSSRSSTPELIIVVDSDNEDEGMVVDTGISRDTENSRQHPLPQLQQIVDTSSIEQSFSQNPPKVLQELFGIVQWVNTGVKRDKSCEKTFMEKKVDEMEKKLVEKEQQLELANQDISELKQIKMDLQREIERLQSTLVTERMEKSEFNRKWVQMKETFKTLQTKYFEDTPVLQSNGLEVLCKPEIVDLKEKQNVPDPSVPVELAGKQDNPVSTMNQEDETSFSGESEQVVVDDDDNSSSMILGMVPVVVQLGPEPGIQLKQHEQPSTSKSTSTMTMTEVHHTFDNSKQHLGVFCVCGMQFSTKRTLDSHVIYFTCEKRFICTLCDKRFVGNNYLKGHMLRSHKVLYTGGLNGCRDCGRTFSSLLQLRRHKKLVHYASYPLQKMEGIVKKDPGTRVGTSSSTKKRRSIRMKRRHQKGESHSALTMLQGNCNNCKFCREVEKIKSKSTLPCRGSSVTGSNAKTQPPKLQSSFKPSMLPCKSRTRHHRSSSVSSSDSTSFFCEYCSKRFGDDKCGLVKHKQGCEARSRKNL